MLLLKWKLLIFLVHNTKKTCKWRHDTKSNLFVKEGKSRVEDQVLQAGIAVLEIFVLDLSAIKRKR